MAALGYPGVFPGALTTGLLNIGAVQKQKSSTTLGYPGGFSGALTTGYLGIGAVQKGELVAAPSMASWYWTTAFPVRSRNEIVVLK